MLISLLMIIDKTFSNLISFLMYLLMLLMICHNNRFSMYIYFFIPTQRRCRLAVPVPGDAAGVQRPAHLRPRSLLRGQEDVHGDFGREGMQSRNSTDLNLLNLV